MKPADLWLRCADHVGIDLDPEQIGLLARYRDWLADEAIPAGGMGPGEQNRIERRHIADSLLFATAIELHVPQIWDIGSGVGLPGIPLAILCPAIEFLLVDRSLRRVQLARRATRVLDLENVQVMQGEIMDLPCDVAMMVSRASLPPPQAAQSLYPLLRPGGRLVLGGSWESEPSFAGWETISLPPEILDHEVWLLMMRHP